MSDNIAALERRIVLMEQIRKQVESISKQEVQAHLNRMREQRQQRLEAPQAKQRKREAANPRPEIIEKIRKEAEAEVRAMSEPEIRAALTRMQEQARRQQERPAAKRKPVSQWAWMRLRETKPIR
jgi:hypothetical protein